MNDTNSSENSSMSLHFYRSSGSASRQPESESGECVITFDFDGLFFLIFLFKL